MLTCVSLKNDSYRGFILGLLSAIALGISVVGTSSVGRAEPQSSSLPALVPQSHEPQGTTRALKPAKRASPENQATTNITEDLLPTRSLQPQLLIEPTPPTAGLSPLFQPEETSHSGNLYLTRAEIINEGSTEQPRYWLVGELSNLSNGWVTEAIIHYKIFDQLWVVQSGHFNVETNCAWLGLQCLQFRFPLRETGRLEIAFVEWLYADGTKGVSQGGTF